MNIFTGNLIPNSYFQVDLGEPILLQVFLLGTIFQAIRISENKKNMVPIGSPGNDY
jgi:hypothetical protein